MAKTSPHANPRLFMSMGIRGQTIFAAFNAKARVPGTPTQGVDNLRRKLSGFTKPSMHNFFEMLAIDQPLLDGDIQSGEYRR